MQKSLLAGVTEFGTRSIGDGDQTFADKVLFNTTTYQVIASSL